MLTASGYEQKALVAPSADVSCNTLAGKLSRRQATMAQFLQVPAKDKFVSVAGFVQSRNNEFGKRMISFVSR
jgi:hypothetical protein